MKKLFILILLIGNSFAANIERVNKKEQEDANRCMKMIHHNSYASINKLPNNKNELLHNGNLDEALHHNFIADMTDYDYFSMDRSIIISGTIVTESEAKIENTVVANMTFIGDVSKISFKGSCLVNVRFPKETSFFTKLRIRREAKSMRNIEYLDGYDRRY